MKPVHPSLHEANAVRQRQSFSDRVTPGLFGVFRPPLGGGVGNSGVSALGLRSGELRRAGPLQAASPSSAGKFALLR